MVAAALLAGAEDPRSPLAEFPVVTAPESSRTGLAYRSAAEPEVLGVTVLHDDGTVTRLPAGSPAARRALSGGVRAAGAGVRAVGLTRPVTALGAARPAAVRPGPSPTSPEPGPTSTRQSATTPIPATTGPKPGGPATGLPTAAEQARQYYLQQIGAQRSWNAGRLGAGITVAVLDSGIDRSHRDLAGQVVAQVGDPARCEDPQPVHQQPR